MTYRPDIDGLRALAVIPIVMFHASVPLFDGGYVGVDVFFVISGYVITASLRRELDAGTFTFVGFYQRRARRIIPALVATLVLTCVGAALVMPASSRDDFSRSLTAASTFTSNVYFWLNSGYFDASAKTRPLLHTWSLSIEEQFYILIPVAMFLTHRIHRRASAALLAAVVVTSLLLSIVLVYRAPSANYLLLPTRAWELGLGCLLTYAPRLRARHAGIAEALGIAGLLGIAGAVVFFSGSTPFPGAAALLPTLSAAALIYSGDQAPTLARRLLSLRPLVVIGLVSYSLYLLHWPLIVFTRYALLRDPQGLEIVGLVMASVAAAMLSWRYVEQPFRARVPGAGGGFGLRHAAIGLTALTAFGLTGAATAGFAARDGDPVRVDAAVSDWKPGVCFLIDQPPQAWSARDCRRTSGAATNTLLWGDSFAAHYVPGLIENSGRLSTNIIQYTSAGCPPILAFDSFALPNCRAFNARALDIVKSEAVDAVILSARWDLIRRGLDDLGGTLDALKALNVRVYVVGHSPTFTFDARILAARGAGRSEAGTATWTTAHKSIQDVERVSVSAGATFIDPLQKLCRGGRCVYQTGSQLLYADYGHFSRAGSNAAVLAYFPLLTPPASDASQVR